MIMLMGKRQRGTQYVPRLLLDRENETGYDGDHKAESDPPEKHLPPANAAAVLNMTIGFKTGAASKKAMPAESGSPLWKSLRVRGMTPHSQTGKTMPINAPVTAAATGRPEIHLPIWSRSRKTSTKPDASVPSKRNGTASTKMPRKTVAKTFMRSHSQAKNPAGIMLAATMTRMPAAMASINVRGRRLELVVVCTR